LVRFKRHVLLGGGLKKIVKKDTYIFSWFGLFKQIYAGYIYLQQTISSTMHFTQLLVGLNDFAQQQLSFYFAACMSYP